MGLRSSAISHSVLFTAWISTIVSMLDGFLNALCSNRLLVRWSIQRSSSFSVEPVTLVVLLVTIPVGGMIIECAPASCLRHLPAENGPQPASRNSHPFAVIMVIRSSTGFGPASSVGWFDSCLDLHACKVSSSDSVSFAHLSTWMSPEPYSNARALTLSSASAASSSSSSLFCFSCL